MAMADIPYGKFSVVWRIFCTGARGRTFGKTACNAVEFLYNSIPGESERLATAKWIVDNFDKAQLIKFITDMMYGIEVIKNVK